MELLEFAEKFCEMQNIALLQYHKELIKLYDKAIKEGKKVYFVRGSSKTFYKETKEKER